MFIAFQGSELPHSFTSAMLLWVDSFNSNTTAKRDVSGTRRAPEHRTHKGARRNVYRLRP